jgi:hypothetical protein
VGLCHAGQRSDSLVRIAVQELEAWYLGEAGALADEYGVDRLRRLLSRARFRNPDAVVQPARALADLLPEFQKVAGARRMARRLTREGNRSRSFRVLLDGIAREAAALASDNPPGGAT